jgi:methyltransferase (TIGR00027 family)
MLDGVGGTGLTVAGIRAEETARPDRLFADPLAAAFVAAAGSPPSRATSRQAAALRLWIVARTVFLDELITGACADGVRQVVLLGAGFDTRAFRLRWPPGVRCFELDTGDVLAAKQQVLTEHSAVAGCERIVVPTDLRGDWPAELRTASLDPAQPAIWVAEGLLVYLSPDQVDQLLDEVTSLSGPGSRLGLTFRNRERGDQSAPAPALRRSAAPEDPVGWLAGHGWAAELAGAREVLQTHDRPVPAAQDDGRAGPRPRALLISAALDRTLLRSRRSGRHPPASAAVRPQPSSPTASTSVRPISRPDPGHGR